MTTRTEHGPAEWQRDRLLALRGMLASWADILARRGGSGDLEEETRHAARTVEAVRAANTRVLGGPDAEPLTWEEARRALAASLQDALATLGEGAS